MPVSPDRYVIQSVGRCFCLHYVWESYPWCWTCVSVRGILNCLHVPTPENNLFYVPHMDVR